MLLHRNSLVLLFRLASSVSVGLQSMADPVSMALSASRIMVSALINPVIAKLYQEWSERRQLEKGVGDSIKQLVDRMLLIKGYLQAADDKPRQNTTVDGWLQQLKDIVYDAEDVLDGYATDLANRKMEAELEKEKDASVIPAAKKLRAKASDEFVTRGAWRRTTTTTSTALDIYPAPESC